MSKIGSFEWNDKYKTGIRVIDSQHAFLFALTDGLIRQVNNGKDISLGSTLDQLLNYADQHFSYEEKILRQAHYNELPGHHSLHVKMKDQLDSYVQDMKQGKLTAEKLVEFLKKWLEVHILTEDMKYAPAVKDLIGLN